MTPGDLSSFIRELSAYVERSPHPERSVVASGVKLAALAADGDEGARTAIFKALKRLFKSKGEKKILSKIDKYQAIKKAIPGLLKGIRSGKPMASLIKGDVNSGTMFRAVQNAEGLSAGISADVPSDADGMEGFAERVDEWWDDDGDNYESRDREAIETALEELDDKCNEDIKVMKYRLEDQKRKQGLGGRKRKKALTD